MEEVRSSRFGIEGKEVAPASGGAADEHAHRHMVTWWSSYLGALVQQTELRRRRS